jgi:hypothetical protein
MEEMRALIGKRQTADLPPVARTQRTGIFEAPRPLPSSGASDDVSRKLEDLISDVDKNLVQALSHQETMQNELKIITAQFREVSRTFARWLCRAVLASSEGSLLISGPESD